MPKNQNAANTVKPNQNENFIYHVIVVLLAGLLSVFLLRGVQKYYSYVEYMQTIQTAAGWVCLVAFVLGLIGLVSAWITGKRSMGWIGGLLLLLGLCAGSIHLYYTEGVTMCYALVLGTCALYILGQIYAREYIVLSGSSLLAAVAYYAVSKYGGSSMLNRYTIPAAVVLFLVLALGIVASALASRQNGRLCIGKWELQLLQGKNAQLLVYLVCAIWAALLLLIFALGATFAWYCVWVVCAALFALTVWFTIKLM